MVGKYWVAFEQVPFEVMNFLKNHVLSNICLEAYDSVKHGYFRIGFIDYLFSV